MKLNDKLNDFLAGEIDSKYNFQLQEKQELISGYFEKILKTEARLGKTVGIELKAFDGDSIVFKDDKSQFKIDTALFFEFIKNAALKNKNSLVVKAFRLKTEGEFKAVIEY